MAPLRESMRALWQRARFLAHEVRSYWQGPFKSSELDRRFGQTAPTAAGISVTPATALGISAVWNAVVIISGSIASLPLLTYRRLPNGGKERYPEHWLYPLLHDTPNEDMGSMVFRETLQQHVLLWGNAYAEIQRDAGGRVTALHIIPPDRVTPKRDGNNRLTYRVRNGNGNGLRSVTLRADEVFHIPGLGWDGTCGYSVVSVARQSLGLTTAAERYGATFFGNNAMPGSVLEAPPNVRLDATLRNQMRAEWNELHRGVDRSHGVAILEGGVTWKQTTIPPDDAQFLQTRKFQTSEVARWFNIPPHKLKDLEHATFTNIEHQGIEFVVDTLRPWLVRWEQEIFRKLIPRLERQRMYAEHLIDGLLRGDTKTRYEAYAIGRQWGWFCVDDIRGFENLNPLPDGQGQVFLVPLNMTSAAAEPDPEPTADDAAPADEDDDDGEPEAADRRYPRPLPPAPAAEPMPESPPTPEPDEPPTDRPRLIAAQRALVYEVAGRMIRREAVKARDRATNPERLRRWIEGFYPRHAETYEVALMPAVRAHLALIGSAQDPQAYARDVVAEHIEESRAQLEALLSVTSGNLAEAVDQLVSRWEIERPALVADRILHEEIAHAAAD